MRLTALPYLACPDCRAELELIAGAVSTPDGHVMTGELRCGAEGCRFPVRDGVPVLRPRHVEALKIATARRFDDEWKHWSELRDYYQRQFLGWVAPLGPEDFAGRIILEAGCGKGRHTVTLAGFQPRALVALDLGESAWVAFAHTRHLPNTHVVVGDLLRPPVRPLFDVGLSVGVIHHLPDPAEGFAALSACVREGGRVVIWVYGQENNEWITRFVAPLRRVVTARMPPRVLRAACAAPAALLWGAIKLFYQPRGGRGLRLPYRDYFASMHDFPFDEIHSIVFDQLVTPVAHYLPGDEVRRWLERNCSESILRWHNRYSWTGVGTVSRVPAPELSPASLSGERAAS